MTRFTKILLAGASLAGMASAAFAQQPLPQANNSYFIKAAAELQKALAMQPITTRAKHIILFIGDGMSIPTITATRIYEGQKKGVDGESYHLTMDGLDYAALSRTYSNDFQVTDSAPSATAMVTGVKANNDTIGVDQTVVVGDCAGSKGHEVETLFEMAEAAGMETGVISTARITHATPAAMYSHTPHRDWEDDKSMTATGGTPGGDCKDIADQLVNWSAGDGFEVALGGGRGYFLPDSAADPEDEGKTGHRTDGRNLTEEWTGKDNDHVWVWNEEQFQKLDPSGDEKVLGLFEGSHMEYEADRAKDKGGEPSLAEMTSFAIKRLMKDDKGFVLMVEGGRIDHAHHAGNAARALEDTVAFDDAVKAALDLTDKEDTLIVVTADHSHSLSIQGYPKRNNPILGLARDGDGSLELAGDGEPYTTLAYANGPGGVFPAKPKDGAAEPAGVREDLTDTDTTSVDFVQQSTLPMSSETHAGDDVAILASGPYAHLFHGIVDENYIYHVMAKAADLMQDSAAVDQPKTQDTASAE